VRYRLIACAVALGLVASGRRASADARTEKAREHYVQGDAYYKLDKYSEALHEYEQAYIAKPDPSFLYNIAQCHRLMGNKPEAVKYYRRYLRDAPVAPNRAIAEKHIRELEAALNHTAEPPPEDASRSGSLTSPLMLPPPTGPATSPQMPAPSETRAPNPTALSLAAPPPADGPSPAPVALQKNATAPGADQEQPRPFYTKWWFWTAVGVVAVGAVVLVLAAGSHDPSCPTGFVCK